MLATARGAAFRVIRSAFYDSAFMALPIRLPST